MLPDRRAVIFDLDDTLYPYRRFVASGFSAVAAHLAVTRGLDRRRTLRLLLRASRGDQRGRELQACLSELGLSDRVLPTLILLLRDHHPRLRLCAGARRMLIALRTDGWRLGILTNGSRAIQARKVATLGLARHVDSVVYATDHGTGGGKPDSAPFKEILRRLDVGATHAVFIGDDPRCDILGAQGAGILAARCRVWVNQDDESLPGPQVTRLSRVPVLVRSLLEEAMASHAA